MTKDCASRPQRQARSKVTYKESDDDDDDFVPSTTTRLQPGVAKGKRTLTLKRARTTLEPPVSLGKEEDVDVYALPAVEEKSAARVVRFRESAEPLLNAHRRQTSAFECLLEAVSDASEEEGGSSAQKSTSHSESKLEVKEETTSAAYGPELLAAYSAFERKLQAVKGVKEEDATVKKSTHEEDRVIQGTKDIKAQENEKSSGDEKKYVRRGDRAKLESMPPSKAESKQDVESCKTVSGTGEQDKPYDMSSTDDDEANTDADAPWNENSDASDTEKKKKPAAKRVTVKPAPPPSKIDQDVKNINLPSSDEPSVKSHLTSAVMPAKLTSAPALLPKKRPAFMTKPFVPPGPKTLQTPTAHRRVVGLSRRHRPPPLHPYLLES